jgi:sugar lactone lactonase YvrE
VDGSRIRKVSQSGIISTVAGNGTYGYSGDGGPAAGAQIQPYGVAVDNAGNLYLSDDGNLRVRMVSANGIISTVAGNGAYGSAGDGGPATAAQLTGASGIAIDGSGNLYFSDSSPSSDDIDCYCVRKVTPAGIITTVSSGAGLFQPRALAVDSGGNLYIADTGNRIIRRVAPDRTLTIAAGSGGGVNFSGDGGSATGAQLFWPSGVATDAGGRLYIGDTFNNRVRVVSPGGTITTIAGNGVGAYAGDGSPATDAEVYFPVGVAVDSRGTLYIADHGNSRIRRVSNAGAIATAARIDTVFSGSEVWNLAVDQSDNLYVPDPQNNRIRKISPEGVVTTVAGNGTHGYSGDGGPATSAQIRLTSKSALTTDNEGSLYFSDDDFQAPPPGTFPGSTLSTPRIRKVSPDGTITTVAGNGTSGYSGDGGIATGAKLGLLIYRGWG